MPIDVVLAKIEREGQRGKEYLFVREKGQKHYKLPGGAVSKDEDHVTALMREVKEETGASVVDYGTEETCKVEKPPIGVLQLHIYTGVKINGEPVPGCEVEEIQWFDADFAKQNRYYIQPEQKK